MRRIEQGLTYPACPTNGHKPDTVRALPARSFRAAACFLGSLAGSGEQAPRCPASHHQPPGRHPRQTARHRHLNTLQFGTALQVPRLAVGRERPRPPRPQGARAAVVGRTPTGAPASTRPRPAGLLYVPKMSAPHWATGSRTRNCGRSTHWDCGSPAPRWSPRLRRSSSRQHRGLVVPGGEAPNPNPGGFASLSVPALCDSGGPIPSGLRRPRNGPSSVTNVTLTM